MPLVREEISLCSSTDPQISKRILVYSRVRGSLCYCGIHLWRHGVNWDCDVIHDVDNDFGRVQWTDWYMKFSHPFTSYFVIFWTIVFHVIKAIKTGARALWISEALRVLPSLRPCARLRLVQGLWPKHDLRASDPYNVRALPLQTWRNTNVVITLKRRHFDVITSKWHCFDVITTSLLRSVFSGPFFNNRPLITHSTKVRIDWGT